MSHLCRAWPILGLLVLSACGSTPASPDTPKLKISGAYEIAKAIASDTCNPSTVGTSFSNPGTVSQVAGDAAFTLNDHGTRNLPGRANSDGSMTMNPSSGLVMDTIAATDTFSSGRFTTTGFDVTVTTDLASNPNPGGGPACRVVTIWHGSKQGEANVIPG